MPRKLVWHLVKAKNNSMEEGAHFNSLFLCFKNAISVEKCMYAHSREDSHALGIPTGTKKQGKPTAVPRIHEE
jgi:hypothetical protein